MEGRRGSEYRERGGGERGRGREREGGRARERQDNITIVNTKCKYATTDIPYHKVIAPLQVCSLISFACAVIDQPTCINSSKSFHHRLVMCGSLLCSVTWSMRTNMTY